MGTVTAAAVSQALRGLTGSSIQVTAPSFMDSSENESVPETPEIPDIPAIPSSSVIMVPQPDTSRVTRPVFSIPENNGHITEDIKPSEISAPEENKPEVPDAILPDVEKSEFETDDSFDKLTVLGQYRGRYILASNESGLILLSIKAARERILFEKMQADIKKNEPATQFLLLPVTIDLSPGDTRLVNKYLEKIKKVGFEVEPFGGNTFVISAVPAAFPDENITGIFYDRRWRLPPQIHQHNSSLFSGIW